MLLTRQMITDGSHDPYAYFRHVLTRLPTRRASQIGELLRHGWQRPYNLSPDRQLRPPCSGQFGFAGRMHYSEAPWRSDCKSRENCELRRGQIWPRFFSVNGFVRRCFTT